MQSLGLSDSTPRTENRLKSLFWPAIANDVDVDYLTSQGFWVCAVIAVMNLVVGLLAHVPVAGSLVAGFYFFAAMGVRERSRFAALAAFFGYALDGFVAQKYTGNGFGVMRILFLALLLANIRAVWLAYAWRERNEPDESPDRMDDTLMDRISDQLPAAVWPVGRFFFYLCACAEIGWGLVLLVGPIRIPVIK